MFSCFKSSKVVKLNPSLSDERDIIFAISRVKYDSRIAEHEIILKTIYKRLLDTKDCKQVGSHWQDIGFQRTDPATDIRGAGMLGTIQMLYMIDRLP